ncbi:MAG: ATP-binding protein, partial [Thermoprotei archaeon]
DADITGPSIPKILGVRGQGLTGGPPGIFPVMGPLGVKVVSMDFLLPSDETPVIWRGPMKSMAIKQFLAEIVWGNLEYLLIDLPPGTGDEALTVFQAIPGVDGAVIVTIPSDLSQLVVKKAVTFTRNLQTRVLGIVENMSGFVCPNCGHYVDIFSSGGGERISREMGVPFLGKVPLDPRVCEASDKGMPFIVEHTDTPVAKAFMSIVEKLENMLEKQRPS